MEISSQLMFESSNDSTFHTPRSRNAPIKASMTTIDGLPSKLKIFRIAGSKYWQMRFYNLGRYTTQSLKTTDVEQAKTFATQVFQSFVDAGVYAHPSDASAFVQENTQQLLHGLIEEVLQIEAEKVRRDEIKQAS